MSASSPNIKELFNACIELPKEERRAYLQKACGENTELVREVELLLQAHESNHVISPVINLFNRELPKTLGKYHVLSILGHGGMGQVLLVKNDAGERFAMKVLQKRLQSQSSYSEMFEYEAGILKLLVHPNIVGLKEFSLYDGAPGLVMEYVDGVNLDELLIHLDRAKSRLPLQLAIYIIARIAEALEYANRIQNLIHRDVTLGNIMISNQGQVKLLDFGIAKGNDRKRFTQTGGVRGTPHYFAPELLSGTPPSHGTDLYALCVVLRELLGEEKEQEKTLSAAYSVEDMKLADSTIRSQMVMILKKGLSADPKLRFQTAAELTGTLRTVIEVSDEHCQKQLGELVGKVQLAKNEVLPNLENTEKISLELPPPKREAFQTGEKVVKAFSKTAKLTFFGIGSALALFFLIRPYIQIDSGSKYQRSPSSYCTLQIRTRPQGARVTVLGAAFSKFTPAKFTLPCGEKALVVVELDGHKPHYVELTPTNSVEFYSANLVNGDKTLLDEVALMILKTRSMVTALLEVSLQKD